MGAERIGRVGGLLPGASAVAVLVALAAGGQVAAVTHPGAATVPGAGRQAVAGIISTLAGGVGGPESGTKVALAPCNVAFVHGHLLIADNSHARSGWGAVREMSPSSSLLTTPAGTDNYGPLGDGAPATAARLSACGVTADISGNLVIGDWRDERIRVVAASTGTFYGQPMTAGDIYTVAGTGTRGFSGDGGPATSAEFNNPRDVRVDHNGNLVIADTYNCRIRVVATSTGTFYGQPMTAGGIYTVAGDGSCSSSGDGGPATSAGMTPWGVTVDSAGNLVTAGDCRIRVVATSTGTFYGQPMTTGDIYTVAGNGVCAYSGDGAPATSAELSNPLGVAVGSAGNLVIADAGNCRVRMVAERTGTFYGQPVTAGDIYTVAGNGTCGFSGDRGPATSAGVNPGGVAVDSAGNLVIADYPHNRVRVEPAHSGTYYGITMTAGDIYTIAGDGHRFGYSGDGGPATSAEMFEPQGVAPSAGGNVLIADTGNDRLRVVAGRTGTFYGQKMTAGDIYTIAGTGGCGFSGDGGLGTRAELCEPLGPRADGAGNVLFADAGNCVIRVVAAKTGTFYQQAMTAGHIYTIAGSHSCSFSGDGGPATKAGMQPRSVVADASGNLVIADSGDNRIRVVAARTGTIYGRAMTAGDIYVIAGTGLAGFSGDGGPAINAELSFPSGVKVDQTGNLVIADAENDRIRVVAESTGSFYGQPMTTGDIYTVAGNGSRAFSGDGGPATSAGMAPSAVAVDAAGNLVIADNGNYRVRVVAESTGSFYGQPMTTGDIYTVAGNGTSGFSGDGGPATKAGLTCSGVAVNGAGDLLIADYGNQRIRMVTG